jgi:hypothetical protein
MGVTSASVIYSFFERQIQPLQKRCSFGFNYLEAEDPSHMSAAELPAGEVLRQVGRPLLDVNTVPYVPPLFSAKNQPKPV